MFDPSLAGLIDEDTRLAGGEVGALDGDPLCDCQDDSGNSFTLGVTRANGPNGAVVEVVRHDHNVKPPAAETIRIVLRRAEGAWRIDDVGSPNMPSLRGYLAEENRKRRR
ncbi:MAG TPA: hypothetical protein VGG68_10905 [Caulobacteraceae bacterium]